VVGRDVVMWFIRTGPAQRLGRGGGLSLETDELGETPRVWGERTRASARVAVGSQELGERLPRAALLV
jgi:hypothetical protein